MTTISKPNLCFIVLLMLANKLAHSQDVTTFTYDTFEPTPNSDDLIYLRGAHVPQGSRFLRLTETDSSGIPKSWSTGQVLHAWPVRFWEVSPARQATFETTIKFIIRPSAQGAADGIAFFIAPPNNDFNNSAPGGGLGIFDGSTGTTPSLFAVEFDTFVNSQWDPNYRHIGIDIESRVSKNVTEFDSATGELVTARINYDANTKTISVAASTATQTASLSYVFDLKTILPDQVEVGISASTGETPSKLGVHDIISWYFTSSLVSDDSDSYIRQIV
ncbi:hypothetical protein ACS0TY_012562 [Phlomoides rotata]